MLLTCGGNLEIKLLFKYKHTNTQSTNAHYNWLNDPDYVITTITLNDDGKLIGVKFCSGGIFLNDDLERD